MDSNGGCDIATVQSEQRLRVIEFDVEGTPKTYNAIGMAHWRVRHQNAKTWKEKVQMTVRMSGSPIDFERPIERARMTFTRFSSRLMDPDNIPQTFKPVMDGLVEAKVLKNDGPKNIVELTYRQEKVKRGFEKIRVRVEEV